MKQFIVLFVFFASSFGYIYINTILFKELNLNTTPPYIVWNNKIFFAADDGIHGNELWTSDGTVAGTNLFWDIVPGSESSNPTNFNGNKNSICVYFVASGILYRTDGTLSDYGYELWVSDGLTANIVVDFIPGNLGFDEIVPFGNLDDNTLAYFGYSANLPVPRHKFYYANTTFVSPIIISSNSIVASCVTEGVGSSGNFFFTAVCGDSGSLYNVGYTSVLNKTDVYSLVNNVYKGQIYMNVGNYLYFFGYTNNTTPQYNFFNIDPVQSTVQQISSIPWTNDWYFFEWKSQFIVLIYIAPNIGWYILNGTNLEFQFNLGSNFNTPNFVTITDAGNYVWIQIDQDLWISDGTVAGSGVGGDIWLGRQAGSFYPLISNPAQGYLAYFGENTTSGPDVMEFRIAVWCGDSIITPPEICDDGIWNARSGCAYDCLSRIPIISTGAISTGYVTSGLITSGLVTIGHSTTSPEITTGKATTGEQQIAFADKIQSSLLFSNILFIFLLFIQP